jgi:hypothetical protein
MEAGKLLAKLQGQPIGALSLSNLVIYFANLGGLSVPAVELRTVSDGFVIKLRDGRNLRCVQNNPRVLRLRDSAPHHAIVLKMEDGSDLLLPIIVSMYLFLPQTHFAL